tara:strand:- start:3997 stop:4212 length:216 start_codon:yes stop_codon:yes gene_type:complete
MNNIIYLKKDPILVELENSVDKDSVKKMIAFKYFNNNLKLLDDYLNINNDNDGINTKKNLIEPTSQLEFSF